MGASVTPPSLSSLLAPILPALPSATISTEPAVGILPLLSPILRQRVQLFSAGSTEPWLRLLCYDTGKAVKLAEVVQSGNLEPHPVSGEVEVDWDYDTQTRYKRVDQETLQAFTVLSLGLAFKLVYCVGDAEGGGDGWRVGEVTVADKSLPFGQFEGVSTISEAETQFENSRTSTKATPQVNVSKANTNGHFLSAPEEDDDDDGYWDRYDATPARTPANNRSPAPPTGAAAASSTYQTGTYETSAPIQDDDDDDYFAQYDQVQPAMDNHDPDEEAQLAHIEPPLGLGRTSKTLDSSVVTDSNETRGSWTFAELDKSSSTNHTDAQDIGLLHPRPESSASSNGSHTVARLEASAGRQEQNEFGVKQHVSRSIRSLYLLARSSGIERDEFERLVKTEMDVLSMIGDQD